MNLLEKSHHVSRLFEELEVETQAFLSQSQLTCFKGCGHCCTNPRVSASVLEFLPLAFDIYRSGQAEGVLALLSTSSEESYCIMLKKLSVDAEAGQCTNYANRGLICRLFASSARRNKHGEKELLTCRKIKDGKKELFEAATQSIKQEMIVPLSSDFYTRLYGIDFNLANEQFVINIAIRKALEAVLSYYYYNQEGNAV